MFATHKLISRSLVLLSLLAVACGAKVGDDDREVAPGYETDPDPGPAPAPYEPPTYDATGPVLARLDGQPTGDGKACPLDGVDWGDKKPGAIAAGISLELGETIGLADGCSDCTCMRQGLECETRSWCVDVRKAQAPRELALCAFGGKPFATGDVFVATDPCHSVCSCSDGQVSCSARECNAACPAPKQPPPGLSCAAMVMTARAPDGTCCTYGSGCGAPDGWPAFSNEADCLDRK